MVNYLAYCQAGTNFYDRRPKGVDRCFSVASSDLPQGWSLISGDHWTHLSPEDFRPREQGWKVHVSAILAEAEEVVNITTKYCLANRIACKFLSSSRIHEKSNRKDATRGSSGKLITIYPCDDDELLMILREVGVLLSGRKGPYILGDLRWGEGPLYIRYGGFKLLECEDDTGTRVPAIRTPDGTLVPDVRGPGFVVPDWASVPPEVAEQIASAQAATTDELPYRIEKALHFSNSGGIYLGADPESGRLVVLREARPYAGLDANGQDAVTRLHHEARVLADLQDLDFVPDLYRCFTVWEHHYLAEEYIEGVTLWDHLAMANPLTRSDPDPAALREYAATVIDACEQLERALVMLHERGYVYADLHPRNVILRPDGRIALVDFEAAYRPGIDPRSNMGVPGYFARHAQSDEARDDYALNSMRLALFLPMPQFLDLAPAKLDEFVETIGRLFPVPAEYLDRIRNSLRRPETPTDPLPLGVEFRSASEDGSRTALGSLIEKLATAVVRSATPERSDRLFPGDPQGLEDGGYSLAHGAAGVLLALREADRQVSEDHLDWLAGAVRRSTVRPGLYNGMHGAAVALHGLGRPEQAFEVLDRFAPEHHLPEAPNLYNGLAGIGLALRYFAEQTEDAHWAEQVAVVTTRLSDLVARSSGMPSTSPAGLFHGFTGAALFLLRRYQDTQDPELLDYARQALEHDLCRCENNGTGELLMRHGNRLLPYLGAGSAGLLEPLNLYLQYRPDQYLAEVRGTIYRACTPVFTIEPALSQGRAGLMLALAAQPMDQARSQAWADHVQRLAWHAVRCQDGIAFPGVSLLRLSMDLCTGTAGVMLALSHNASAGVLARTPHEKAANRMHAMGLPAASSIDVRPGPDASNDWSKR